MTARETIQYSVLKFAEGGPVLKNLISLLRSEGLEARRSESPYVGEVCVSITGTKRQHAKARRIIFG